MTNTPELWIAEKPQAPFCEFGFDCDGTMRMSYYDGEKRTTSITIDPKTAEVEIDPSLKLSDAAKLFWQVVAKSHPLIS